MIPIEFIEKYITREGMGEVLPFKLNTVQRYALRVINKYSQVMIYHSRQVGVDELLSSICAYYMTQPDINIAYLDRDCDCVYRFIKKTKDKYSFLPDGFKSTFLANQKARVVLDNGAMLRGEPISNSHPTKVLHAQSPNLLIVNNMTHIRHVEDAWPTIYSSMLSAIKLQQETGRPFKIILASSYADKESWFWTMWKECILGDSAFKPILMHYDILDEDEFLSKPAIDQLKNISPNIEREYELV